MSQKQNAKDNKYPYGSDRFHMYNLAGLLSSLKGTSQHKRVIRKSQDKLRKPITDFVMFEAFDFTSLILNYSKRT